MSAPVRNLVWENDRVTADLYISRAKPTSITGVVDSGNGDLVLELDDGAGTSLTGTPASEAVPGN